MPQQSVAGRALLTLRHYGYGMEPLSADQTNNPFDNSALTWLRVCAESSSFDAACRYFASGTRASVLLQSTPAHVDGVARRKQQQRTAVEMVTTRWAHAAATWTDGERRASMALARSMQPLVAKSLWLRTSIALDITPCRGLALVAVSSLKPLCDHQLSLPLLILLSSVHTARAARIDRAPSQSTECLCRSRTTWGGMWGGMWSVERSHVRLHSRAAPTTVWTTMPLRRRRGGGTHRCRGARHAATPRRRRMCVRGKQPMAAASGSLKCPTGLCLAPHTQEGWPTRVGESRTT
jgi:hypothetical protein